MRSARLNRGSLLALALLLTLLLASCVRPLRDEDEPSAPDQPDVSVPAGETDDAAPAPDQPAEGTDTDPGQAPATGDQPADAPADSSGAEQAGGETEAADQPPAPVTYIVQAGDTLDSVAQRYNVSVDALAMANSLAPTAALSAGQKLVIPVGGPTTEPPAEQADEQPPAETTETGEIIHTVQAGENLFRIGLRYGFSVAELAAYNNIANPNFLEIGQQIRIPAK